MLKEFGMEVDLDRSGAVEPQREFGSGFCA
jgi:hypothetical protein